MKAALVVLLSGLMLPLFAAAAAPLTDHPLISRYEGSELKRKDVKAFDAYSAFKGMDASGKVPTGIDLEGKVTRLLYTKPKDRSILEVFRNYEQAVEKAGGQVLFRCDQEKKECAAAYAGPTLGKFSGLQAISNVNGRYLLAKVEQGAQTAYVAIAVGRSFTDVHVVEVKAMQTGMVVLDAAALGDGLDQNGFVVVDGIFFDTDKSTLKPESEPALVEMAKLLKARPKLRVFVVGHTDAVGSLAHNQALSSDRAKAVVAALADRHGVERDRLDGHGVGPLAPQASNADEGGRARNRRVVMVARDA